MSSSTRVLPILFLSRKLRIRLLLLAITVAACVPSVAGASHSHSLSPDGAAEVEQAVRVFMQTVSHSVTQDGPDQVFRREPRILYGRQRPDGLPQFCRRTARYAQVRPNRPSH